MIWQPTHQDEYADNSEVIHAYDAIGRETATTDERGNTTDLRVWTQVAPARTHWESNRRAQSCDPSTSLTLRDV